MTPTLIDGKEVAASVRARLQVEIEELKAQGHTPGLAVVLVGEDPASQVYVGSKVKACAELGLYSQKWALPAETTQEELVELIHKLNADDRIHGILVQSPPPPHIDEEAVILNIDPRKDVDGFHPANVAKLVLEDAEGFVPCTPLGCMELLKAYGIETAGKHAVVIGRSMIVGKPMANLLVAKNANATVTIAHSRTADLPEVTRGAEILVVAIGRPKFITADMVSEGAVVIDVGVNRDPQTGRLCGDVDFSAIEPKASVITPVQDKIGGFIVTSSDEAVPDSASGSLLDTDCHAVIQIPDLIFSIEFGLNLRWLHCQRVHHGDILFKSLCR